MEKITIPKIRFKGFDGDWEEKSLGDVSDKSDYGLNAAAMEFDGKNKYLRITDIDENNRKFIISNITSPNIDLRNKDDYKLKEGDITFARTGASVGKSYIYNKNDGEVYFAGFLIRFRVKSNTDSKFVFYNTLTKKFNKFVSVMSMRSGQPGINSAEYKTYKFNLPSLQEQKKIGNLFVKIDELIENQEKYLEENKKLKKAMLQKLFPKKDQKTPELRLKGFKGDWEEKKLIDTIETEYKGKSKFEDLNKGQIEYLDANRLNGGDIFYADGTKDVEKNNILILWDGSKAGKLYYGFEGILGSTLKKFVINKSFSSSYIYYYLKNNQNLIYNSYRTPNIPHVIKDFTEIFKIIHPSLEEQEAIGNFFKSLDEKIELEEEKLENYKRLKKSLLQKIFI